MCSSTFCSTANCFQKINLLKFQFSLVLRLVLQTETEKLGGLIVFPSLFFFSFFFFTFSVEVLLLFSLLMVYLFIFWLYLFLILQATHSKCRVWLSLPAASRLISSCIEEG